MCFTKTETNRTQRTTPTEINQQENKQIERAGEFASKGERKGRSKMKN